MSPRPASAPHDVTTLTDDFEWPPKGDTLSVHEIAAEPWRTATPSADAADPLAVTVTVTIDDEASEPASEPPATPRPPVWRRNR